MNSYEKYLDKNGNIPKQEFTTLRDSTHYSRDLEGNSDKESKLKNMSTKISFKKIFQNGWRPVLAFGVLVGGINLLDRLGLVDNDSIFQSGKGSVDYYLNTTQDCSMLNDTMKYDSANFNNKLNRIGKGIK